MKVTCANKRALDLSLMPREVMNDAFPASVKISVLAAILSEGDNKLSLI